LTKQTEGKLAIPEQKQAPITASMKLEEKATSGRNECKSALTVSRTINHASVGAQVAKQGLFAAKSVIVSQTPDEIVSETLTDVRGDYSYNHP